ncbi:MAG: glycosyltransferase family 39 protein [Chlamydiota bacterium]|nr:glycosyltransferase family 39 protein [Chlamydiota bacterium]
MQRDSISQSVLSKQHWFYIIALLLLGYCFFYLASSRIPLLDPDEPRYAEAAREMLETGDWINPQFNYINRWDKPVLFYWFLLWSFQVAGVSASAARFVPALFGTLVMLLIFFWGWVRGRARHGFLAACIWASMVIVVTVSRLVITDMALCFFIALSIALAYESWKKPSRLLLVMSYSSMAIASLIKGPVGIVLPGLVFVVFLLSKRDISVLFHRQHLLGFFVFLLISVPWYWIQTAHYGMAFLQYFFIKHNLQRAVTDQLKHTEALYYYIPIILGGIFPWTVYLPQSLMRFKEKWSDDWFRINMIWCVTVLVVFSLSRAKLPTYILSLFVPMAMLLGSFWDNIFSDRLRPRKGLFISLAVLGLIHVVFISIFPQYWYQLSAVDPGHMRMLFVPSFFVILIMLYMVFRDRFRFVFVMMIAYLFLIGIPVLFSIGPTLGQMRSMKSIANVIPEGAEVGFYKLYKPSLVFYTKRCILRIDTMDALKNKIKQAESFYCVMRENEYQQLKEQGVDLYVLQQTWDKVLVINKNMK